ncbi:MAG: S-methyl-5-thioribose-1-phosphate isomerase, partial [Candidatus Latescibacteria bacterium]|nr:S-methyl-5-thioribose-1-phosphate isomerase [Candidatus Latescibacterota bacterium]
MPVPTITWKNDALRLIDQTLLPEEYTFIDCRDVDTVAEAIVSLRVRGAPAIGVAAAYGVVVAAQEAISSDADFDTHVRAGIKTLSETRPTAVNLFWALERQEKVLDQIAGKTPENKRDSLLKEAHKIFEDDKKICRQIGRNGAELLGSQTTILTHCNAGGLA